MTVQYIVNVVYLSPLAFLATALLSYFQPGLRPKHVKSIATAATIFSILIAAISGVFISQHPLIESTFFGYKQFGLSLRLDSVSVLMFSMIALLSFIILRFSKNYLDGDVRQGAFIGRLAATIAAVQLLVLSGNVALLLLAWVFTSISLHRLLVFYHERPGAIIAARKKFLVARLGDVSLLGALIALYLHFGTGNLEVIFQQLKITSISEFTSSNLEVAAILLVIAALLKSAQFPTHGWLIEVMETPTPVSALLHAGLLNAGPFLIIRMAYVIESSAFAPLALIAIGGFTALFASVAFLTQTSVKTALAYSSIAHMGFSLMTCGMGVYSAAMLHLVAHSFYKAHSFLSSGSAIDIIRAAKVSDAIRTKNPFRIVLGILLGLGVYAGSALLWGINPENETALLGIGSIIALGLSRLFTSALDSSGGIKLLFRAALLSLLVALVFFTLEAGSHELLSAQLPELSKPNFSTLALMVIVLIAFAATVFIQIIVPSQTSSFFFKALAIHFRNGFYLNTLFDNTVRALYTFGSEKKPAVVNSSECFEKNILTSTVQLENQPIAANN